MSRAGDKDEGGHGGSIAQIADAARRRTDRPTPQTKKRPQREPSQPDASPGTELITSLYGDEHDDHVEALAEDVLDQALARQPGATDAALRTLPRREAPGSEPRTDVADPGHDDHQSVREILEHHHERRNPRELSTMTPRGSADFAPPSRKTSAPRERRSPVRATGTTRPRRRVAGSLAAALIVVVIVAVAAEAGSSTRNHHGTPAAVTRASTHGVTIRTSPIALDVTGATAAIGVEGKAAASAHTAMAARAKARAKARARARAKAAERARAARARRRQEAAERAHPTPTAGSTGGVSTGATATNPVYNPPSSPTNPSSTGSTSGSGGGSGSSSAPAGPTGIGSAGSNCNPKCS